MAAIDFPDSPSVNDTFTVGSKTWTWNGSYWISDEAATGLDGLNDVTITSPVDGDVIQYDNGEFVNSPVDYTDLTSVPNDFTPSAHTHTKSEITDFAHASTHELGGSDEIEIEQSQVTDLVSDLADKQDDVITTQGDLVIGDASGDPVRLPVGSADQVLTSDGTTVSFQDAGGGGGGGGATGLVELINQSIPATPSITLSGLSGYSFYHIELDSARLSIGGAVEFQQFNTDATGHLIGLEYNNGDVLRYTQPNAKFKVNVNSDSLDIFMNVQIFNAGDNGIASANFVGGSNTAGGVTHRWGQARITKNSLPLDEIVINGSGSDFQATGNIRVYGGLL